LIEGDGNKASAAIDFSKMRWRYEKKTRYALSHRATWGRDKGREATVISAHPTASDAFEALDRVAEQVAGTGGRIEGVELPVTDSSGRPITRPGVQ
jgi:hypothetical protein